MTVRTFLEERGAAAVLSDPLMAAATAEVATSGRTRPQIDVALKRKEAARKALAKKYSSVSCDAEDVLNAIYSFSDNNTYLMFNRDPVERMISHLKSGFAERNAGDRSLAICSGVLLCRHDTLAAFCAAVRPH